MWNKTHSASFFFIYCVHVEQSCWPTDPRCILPPSHPHAEAFNTLFVYLSSAQPSLEQNGQLLGDTTFCSSPSWWWRDKGPCGAVTQLHTLGVDAECLCRAEPASRASKHTRRQTARRVLYLTGHRSRVWQVRWDLGVLGEAVKHNGLWIRAPDCVILEDDCDKAQRALHCCHLLPLLCSPDKSYVYREAVLCEPFRVKTGLAACRTQCVWEFMHVEQEAAEVAAHYKAIKTPTV